MDSQLYIRLNFTKHSNEQDLTSSAAFEKLPYFVHSNVLPSPANTLCNMQLKKNGNQSWQGFKKVTSPPLLTAVLSFKLSSLLFSKPLTSQQLLNAVPELLAFFMVTQPILYKCLHIAHFLATVIAFASHQCNFYRLFFIKCSNGIG